MTRNMRGIGMVALLMGLVLFCPIFPSEAAERVLIGAGATFP